MEVVEVPVWAIVVAATISVLVTYPVMLWLHRLLKIEDKTYVGLSFIASPFAIFSLPFYLLLVSFPKFLGRRVRAMSIYEDSDQSLGILLGLIGLSTLVCVIVCKFFTDDQQTIITILLVSYPVITSILSWMAWIVRDHEPENKGWSAWGNGLLVIFLPVLFPFLFVYNRLQGFFEMCWTVGYKVTR